jgi:hypothetical protein
VDLPAEDPVWQDGRSELCDELIADWAAEHCSMSSNVIGDSVPPLCSPMVSQLPQDLPFDGNAIF